MSVAAIYMLKNLMGVFCLLSAVKSKFIYYGYSQKRKKYFLLIISGLHHVCFKLSVNMIGLLAIFCCLANKLLVAFNIYQIVQEYMYITNSFYNFSMPNNTSDILKTSVI